MPRPSRPSASALRTPVAIVLLAFAFAGLSRSGAPLDVVGLGATASAQASTFPKAQLQPGFVPNRGQFRPSVRYVGRGDGYAFGFERDRVALSLQRGDTRTRLSLRFIGVRRAASLEAQERAAGTVSYFLGKDPASWVTSVPTFDTLVYRSVWPGIDVAFRQQAGRLKYAFHVRPGARSDAIGLAYAGASGLALDGGGNLVVSVRGGSLTDQRPTAYQLADGRRAVVKARFVVRGSTYGFATGPYDRDATLVIDPGLVYSSYLGGSAFDGGMGISVDQAGAAYVTGRTASLDFPATGGSFDTSASGLGDVFLAKVSPDGSGLVYAAYLGGSALDEARGVRVDGSGNAYVTGFTSSPNFPSVAAQDASYNGGRDAFVAKVDPTGSTLLYSTYLGGSGDDNALALSLAPAGGVYLTGETSSTNFPATPGAFDTSANGDFDTFVSRIGPDGSLDWSTYLGSTGFDDGLAIATGPNGNPYVTGKASAGHPTTPGAFDTTANGGFDAMIAQFSADGTELVYCTFLGGDAWDEALGMAVDAAGNAYVTGNVQSADYPTTPGAFDRSLTGPVDLFLTKVNASGSALVYSTFAGGTSWDESDGLAVDGLGRAYVTGHLASSDYPTTAGALDTTANGDVDAFLTVFTASGAGLAYSTYLGSSAWDGGFALAIDSAGAAYVTGFTDSQGFPTTPGAADTTANGATDAFVTNIDPGAAPPPSPDFSLSASPASRLVAPGDATTYSVTVAPANGFSGSVSLGASGLPGGATASFAPNPTTSTSTLTITTSSATPPGTYPITITGTSGGLARSTGVTLEVQPSPSADFALVAMPTTRTARRGSSASYTIDVQRTGGFAGAISLSATNVPAGVSASFSPNPATSSSILTLLVARSAKAGTYSVVVAGTSGGQTHTVGVELVVTK